MKKLVTLRRRCTVFGVLIALCAVALVFRPAETSTQRTQDLPEAFEGFAGERVAAIELTQEGSLLSGGRGNVRVLKRVQILLGAADGATEEQITTTVGTSVATIYRIKRRFVEAGIIIFGRTLYL